MKPDNKRIFKEQEYWSKEDNNKYRKQTPWLPTYDLPLRDTRTW